MSCSMLGQSLLQITFVLGHMLIFAQQIIVKCDRMVSDIIKPLLHEWATECC